MHIEKITQNKKDFLDLLLLADPEEEMLYKYLNKGDLFALYDNGLKTVAVVVELDQEGCELKNIATREEFHGQGYGKKIVDFLFTYYKDKYKYMFVGTGDSDLTIPFYEKRGFKYSHTVKNFFTDNYPEPIIEDGILLVDMIYLKKEL